MTLKELAALLGTRVQAQCFNEEFNREQAEKHLTDNPTLPFLFRNSSIKGQIAISYMDENGKFQHHIVNSPNVTIKTTNNTEMELDKFLTHVMDIHKTRQIDQTLMTLEKGKIAVLSTQHLEGHGSVALTAKQVEETKGLAKGGDGHTGLTMAKALKAPFVVMRTAGNRKDANEVLTDHLKHADSAHSDSKHGDSKHGDSKPGLLNGGLLVITGHGSRGGKQVSGNYHTIQISRKPEDIVSSAMEEGLLKKGDKITVLLTICHGAKDMGDEPSFASRLAKAFAKEGISTTIIASDIEVKRFGESVKNGGRVVFNDKIGMAPENVHVFSTQVTEKGTENPTIECVKYKKTIELSHEGLKCTDAHKPKVQARAKAEETSRLAAEKTKKDLDEARAKQTQMGQIIGLGRAQHAQLEAGKQAKSAEQVTPTGTLSKEEKEVFEAQKVLVFNAIIRLQEQLRPGGKPKGVGTTVDTAANNLHQNLGKAYSRLIVPEPTSIQGIKDAKANFLQDFTRAINDSKEGLKEDIGWCDLITNLFRYVCNLLTSDPKEHLPYIRSQSIKEIERTEEVVNSNLRMGR